MATGKGTKRTVEAALDAGTWNTLERLILSQALYEFGVDNMLQVATLMSAHAMLSRPKNFFTVKSCSVVYEQLMEEAIFTRPEPATSRHAKQLKDLATIHYQRRLSELQNDIQEEESRFKNIVREIDEIRAGLWDDRIRRNFGITLDGAAPEEPIASEADAEAEARMEAEAEVANAEEDLAPLTDANESVVPTGDTEIQMETAPEIRGTSPAEEEEVSQVEEPMDAPDQVLEVSEPSATAEPAEEEEEDPSQEIEKVVDEVDTMEEDQEPRVVERQEAEEPDPDQPVETLVEPEEVETEQELSAEALAEAQVVEQDVEMSASPGSESLRDAKRKASEAPSDTVRDRKRAREDSEAVEEDEPGPSNGRGRKKTQSAPDKKFQNVINMLHSSISQHRYGNIFHNPIKKQDASDYHDIVKRPMDLKTIKQRVKEGVISNSLEFQRDVYLMFANAMIYNRPGSEIHAMAEEMMLESEIQINAFRQTEGFHRL